MSTRLCLLCCFLTSLFTSARSWAQETILKKQLEQSQHLRFVMQADERFAGRTRWLAKRPTQSRELPLAADFKALQLKGPGTIKVTQERTHSGNGSVLLETPTSTAVKNPTNRSYGFPELIRPLTGEDLSRYNRFSVWVYVESQGFYSVFLGLTLYNQGKHTIPVPGRFEGQHFETVYPGKWHRITWEIPDIYRDSVTALSVNIMLTGSPKGAGEVFKLYVDDMRLETVDQENTRGFDLRKSSIAYCHSGYRAAARKQALVQHNSSQTFTLVNARGKTVFTGKPVTLANDFQLLDFSTFKQQGFFSLRMGTTKSQPFPIGDQAWLATAWRTLNFFFAERCGYDQPGIHQQCHREVVCVHPDGRTLPASGGWHDAADVSQGVGNTARGGIAMLELAESVRQTDSLLYKRLLEEARWGLDWTLETRFGDGYRDGGLIMGIWSDNITGTKDDMQAKASNNPFDNFIGAAFAARAVPFYEKEDAVFARWCRNSALADFQFALDKMGAARTDRNETELNALALVSAMELYKLTHQQQYLDQAVEFASVVMACQQQDRRTDWTIPLHGFFYESKEKKRPLEYFHRSNEELMIQGLAMLIKASPRHPQASNWMRACRLYAAYLADVSATMPPYGLIPAAIYELNNADFSGIYHEGERVGLPSMEEYNAEVKNGIHLGGNFYLRRFPVAYQFRGFHAIHISKAKAAFILSDLLQDRRLHDIATRQLEYIVGFNPFAMSTIYGDGYDYPPLYGGYAGDVVGAVPVGIETFEDDDEPYMPMQVNATYKEIWTHTTAGVLWLLSRIMKD